MSQPALWVFIDANPFIYHFAPHPRLGNACTELLERIESHEVTGYTSTHVVSEVAHRLMTLEASAELSRPAANVLQHLRRHPATVQRLRLFRQAIDAILDSAIHILPISPRHLGAAALVSQETGLLSNDALIVALMRQCGLTNLASHDADFDRVPDIERFWP